jgi:hypothetical protein
MPLELNEAEELLGASLESSEISLFQLKALQSLQQPHGGLLVPESAALG